MTQAAAKTGVGPTVTVAVEQQFPENQRIIEDNLAYSILPFSMRTTETGIRTTFDFLAKAARGSRLVFTYIRKDFLDGQVVYGQAELYKQYVVRNKVWLFGMAPERVAKFLGSYGWGVVEHLGYEELAERYVKPKGTFVISLSPSKHFYMPPEAV